MRSITARYAQVFVAGAFAIRGLQALLHLPHTVAVSQGPVFPIAEAIGALALPLGIAILIRNVFAVPVAYVYLWLDVLFGCAVLTAVSPTSGLRIFQNTMVRDAAVTTVGQMVLLSLLFWSRRRQRRESETTTPRLNFEVQHLLGLKEALIGCFVAMSFSWSVVEV